MKKIVLAFVFALACVSCGHKAAEATEDAACCDSVAVEEVAEVEVAVADTVAVDTVVAE